MAARRTPGHGIASSPRSASSIPVSTAAAAPVRSTARSFWSWAALTSCSSRSIWKTPTWAISPGNAAGKFCISRPAWSITNIAAPSANAFRKPTSSRCSRRTSCCSPGRISTIGAGCGSHFFFTWAGATLSWLAGDSPERPSFSGILRAFLALPRTLVSRSRARALATVSDREAFRRPLGGHYRDTFRAAAAAIPRAWRFCSYLPTRSVLPCTAAACSCTRPCVNWPGCATST